MGVQEVGPGARRDVGELARYGFIQSKGKEAGENKHRMVSPLLAYLGKIAFVGIALFFSMKKKSQKW